MGYKDIYAVLKKKKKNRTLLFRLQSCVGTVRHTCGRLGLSHSVKRPENTADEVVSSISEPEASHGMFWRERMHDIM